MDIAPGALPALSPPLNPASVLPSRSSERGLRSLPPSGDTSGGSAGAGEGDTLNAVAVTEIENTRAINTRL